MDNSIMYEEVVNGVFEKAAYKVGYICIVDGISDATKCTYWYKGKSVFYVKSAGTIIDHVKYCNGAEIISLLDMKVSMFMHNLYQFLRRSTEDIFAPSILDTFTDIIFREYAPNTEKLSAVMAVSPKFVPEFRALFQNEIDAMTKSETNLSIRPNQFEFYKNKGFDSLHYVSDIVENTIALKEIGDTSLGYKILDLRELYNEYEKVNMPCDLDLIVKEILSTIHEIVNRDELLRILQFAGFKDTYKLASIQQPYNFEPADKIKAVNGTTEKDCMVYAGEYRANIYCGGMSGFISLRHITDHMFTETYCNVSSILELVSPFQFHRFASEILISFSKEFCYWLDEHKEIRNYLSELIWAIDEITDPVIKYDVKWEDFGDLDSLKNIKFSGFGLTGDTVKALSAFDPVIGDDEEE